MRFGTIVFTAAAAIAISACSSSDPTPAGDTKNSPVIGGPGNQQGNASASEGGTQGPPANTGALTGVIVPSNLPADICDTPATKDVVLQGYAFDYSTCDANIVQGNGAPDICVVKGNDVTIHQLVGIGTPPLRAIAVVATNALTVDGLVDVGAQPYNTGNATVNLPGSGAASGTSDGNGTGVPLMGGVSGAWGGNDGRGQGGSGGGGGGAVQLVACKQLTLTSNARINAGGGGGSAGEQVTSGPSFSGGAGGGGGDGGMILLEAAQMTLAGGLAANGGGGGGGGGAATPSLGAFCSSGGNGATGAVATSQTPGGSSGGTQGGGAGGLGGSVAGAPTQGAAGGACNAPPGTGRPAGPGGDGGGAGHIRLNVPAGTALDTTGAIFSPAPSIGTVATH